MTTAYTPFLDLVKQVQPPNQGILSRFDEHFHGDLLVDPTAASSGEIGMAASST